MRERSVLGLIGVLVLAAAAACDSGAGARQPPTAAPVAEVAATGDPATALPPEREVWAWQESEGVVSALANQAPRADVLGALSRAADFHVVVGAEAALLEPLTVRIEKERVEVALARILVGIDHGVAYDDVPETGARRVARVRVGSGSASGPGPVASAARARRSKKREQRPVTAAELEDRAERAARLRAESLASLESAYPEVRSEGARWLDVNSGEGFSAAVDRLANDEAPEVRIAAAEALIDGDVGAVQPLLQALGDPDPRVVIAALDALEFVGDEATVPHLAPLLEHKNTEVRERTIEAIEFLQ